MFTNPLSDEEYYRVFFTNYADRHFMKRFSKDYPDKRWQVTVDSIYQDLRRVHSMQMTQQVDELKRGKGIATRVIALSEDKIKAHRGYTSICLDASPDNKAALAFYHKLGYVTLGMITVRKELKKSDRKNEIELLGLTYKY